VNDVDAPLFLGYGGFPSRKSSSLVPYYFRALGLQLCVTECPIPSLSVEEGKEKLKSEPILKYGIRFLKEIGFIDTYKYCPLGIPY